MPKLDQQAARNAAGRIQRPVSAEGRRAIDDVMAEVSEIRGAHEDRIAAAESEISAMRDTLGNDAVQAGLDRILAVEERLAFLPTDGEASIQGRLADAEVALQRLSHDGGGAPGEMPVARVQAMEIMAEAVARNPVWGQLIDRDTALTDEYAGALCTYLSRGMGVISNNDRLKTLVCQANAYGEQVINNPKALRTHGGVTDQIMATLTTDFDPGAGMRVPLPLATRIVRRANELSPLLTDSGQASTSSKVWPFLRETGWDPTLRTRGERQDVVEDDDNDELWVEDQINVIEQSVTTRMSLPQIEDGIDVLAEYEYRTSRLLGKRSSLLVHFGSGNQEPLGLTRDPSVPRVLSGVIDALPFRALLNASLDLDPEFEVGANYYLSKGATKAAVLATDAVGGYIWQASQLDGTPSLLHGYRWKRDAYMANETAVTDTGVTFATGSYPVLFGNVGVGCIRVERLGLQVMIDDVTKKGWRKYWTRLRWGWGVIDPAALRLVEIGV